MKKTSKSMLLIFSLVIAVALSLSSVSAGDAIAVDEDIISVDDSISDVSLEDVSLGENTEGLGNVDASSEDSSDTVSIGGDKDTLGDGDISNWYVDSNVGTTGDGSQASPFKTIKEAIYAGNGTIYLASGIYNSTDDMGFDIQGNSNYTIIGSGSENTIIDLLTSYRFLTNHESTIYLSNVKIINGKRGIMNFGNLTIENCVFENCIDNAVRSYGNSLIKNCTFKNNIADTGAVCIDNNYLNIPIKNIVEDCNFFNSLLYDIGNRGSAVSVNGGSYPTDVILKNCNFTQCRRTIYLNYYANVSLENCIFTNNHDDEYDPFSTIYSGSVITVDRYANVTIESCIFENNTRNNGSLIVANGGESRDIVIKNSKFINNVPNMINAVVKAAYGGNIFLENNTCDSVFVEVGANGVKVVSNVEMAALDGQTVNIDSPLIQLYGVLTDDNDNLLSYSLKYVKLTLNGTQIAANLNVTGGYCNYSYKEKLNGTYNVNYLIVGPEFTNITYKEGLINVDPIKDNLNIYVATTGSDETGEGTEENPYKTVEKGLSVADTVCNANLYIKGGTYTYQNYTTIDTLYGQLNIIGYDGDVVIDMGGNSSFFNITNRSNVEISNIAFINGYKSSYDAENFGIINSFGNLTLRYCNFTNNKGYGTTVNRAKLVDSCTFSNNIPMNGFYGLDLNQPGTVVNSSFYYAGDSRYSSIVVGNKWPDGTFIESCRFYNNASLAKTLSGNLYIKSCEFINPNVISISVKNDNISIDNCTFINASNAAIGLSGDSTIVNITNCNFINNTGTGSCSAIYDQGIAELYLENNTIENNAAPYVYLGHGTSITSATTIVILNNETIEQERYGAILKAKILDDKNNPIALNDYIFSFDFNGESAYASIVNDEMVAKYMKLLNGVYLVNANTESFKMCTVKTAVLIITPLMNKDLYVSTTGSDEIGDGSEANPYATLQKAMEEAIAFNNTIHVAEGVYNVDNALAIDTNTATVNIVGSGENTIFNMNNAIDFINSLSANSIVEIKDLTLANAKSPANAKGGFITSEGILTLNNVNLINSTGSNGAAIRNTGNLTVVDSYFENTVAKTNGGAIWSNEFAYILNTVFNKTTAKSGGAIYSNTNNYLYIRNNTFIDTSATTNGKNIFSRGIIEGGLVLTVMDNETWDIDSSAVTLNASLTDENNNPISVSRIPVSFYLDGIKLVSVNIEGDIVTTTINIKLSGVHILSATFGSSEDVVVKNATLNFISTDVLHDVYISADGNDETGEGTGENPYASFTKALSVVESVNGVIHVMSNYTLTENNAISNMYGLTIVGETDDINFKGATGRIFTLNAGSSLKFENIKFSENSNTQTLIYSNAGSTLSLENCIFENNIYMGMYDSAIKFIDASCTELNLINCYFVNNIISTYSYYTSGILIRTSANSNFINCTFKNNNYSIQSYAGNPIISVRNNDKALFENCVFEDNVGGFFDSQSTKELIVDNCSFINNNGEYGFAISGRGNQISINNSKFEKSVAHNLIYLSSSHNKVNIYNNTFDSNEGSYHYLFLADCAELNIIKNTFQNNTALNYLIQIQNNAAVITENTFQNNHGKYSVFAQSGVLTIFNNVLDDSGEMQYVKLGDNAKINGSDSYTLIVNDNATHNVEGNIIELNATFMDAEGNCIAGAIYFTLNGEELNSYAIQGDYVSYYRAIYSENGEVLASAHTNNVYNPDSLTIKTAVFNVTQLESKFIYVDFLGNDETGDGSEENPYATLLRAMKDVVAMNNIIYIQPGVYDNLSAGDFELCDNQTLEIIGLSNEVDKVIIKNLDKFIELSYDSTKFSSDKFAIRNIEFTNITTNQRLFSFVFVDDVEFSNVNINNCQLTSLYLISNHFSHLTLSNVTVSALNYSYHLIFTDQWITSDKTAFIKIYDSIFENFNTEYAHYAILFKQTAIIENSVFNNITSGSLFSLNELNCTNSTFSNIKCANGNLIRLISGQDSHNNIVESVFTNCTVNDFIIDAYSNQLSVYNSVFASNTFRNIISGSNMVVNNNWWGYNATAEDLVVYTTGNRVDNWIVAEVTANDSDIKIGDTVKFDLILKLNDGSELTSVLPIRIVQAIADNTAFNPESVEVVNNAATITGTVSGTGDITISIDNQDFIFDVKGYNAYIQAENVVIKVGENATIGFTLTDGNGPLANKEITISVNNVDYTASTDSNGIASVEIEGLAEGSYIATAYFAGDDLHEPTAGFGLVMVSNSVLTVDVPAVNYGEQGTIGLGLVDTESNPLSGLVIVSINGKEYNIFVNNGAGSLIIPDKLDAGEYNVIARLMGDSITEATTTFIVNKLQSDLSVTVSNISYGSPITINLDIADRTISGSAIVSIGGVEYAVDIVDGVATKVISAVLDADDYEVLAKFIGANYDIADAIGQFTVNPLNTNLNIGLSANEIKYGEDLVVDIGLTDENNNPLSSNVDLIIGDNEYLVAIINGMGSIVINDLDANNFTVSAKYNATNNYKDSADIASLTVKEDSDSNLSVKVDGNNIIFSLFDSTGKGLNGTVNVTIDDITTEVNIVDGKGVINNLTNGEHTISVNYLGDANHAPVNISESVNVVPENPVIVKKATIITYKNMVTNTINAAVNGKNAGKNFSITLKDSAGKVLANKEVIMALNGKVYKLKTNAKGVASLRIAISKKGNYPIAVSFLGDDDYNGSFVLSNVKVNLQKVKLAVAEKKYKANMKSKVLTATLKSANNKFIKGKKLVFSINGKKYIAKTNKKGIAKVKVNLPKKKTYKVTVSFAGDNTFKAITKKGKVIIK